MLGRVDLPRPAGVQPRLQWRCPRNRPSVVRRRQLQERLAQADRHVSLGQKHVEEQRCLIEEMERRGLDQKDAMILLRLFEELQKEHVAYRDYLRQKLEDPDSNR